MGEWLGVSLRRYGWGKLGAIEYFAAGLHVPQPGRRGETTAAARSGPDHFHCGWPFLFRQRFFPRTLFRVSRRRRCRNDRLAFGASALPRRPLIEGRIVNLLSIGSAAIPDAGRLPNPALQETHYVELASRLGFRFVPRRESVPDRNHPTVARTPASPAAPLPHPCRTPAVYLPSTCIDCRQHTEVRSVPESSRQQGSSGFSHLAGYFGCGVALQVAIQAGASDA
jgi:hypothetical protein